MTEQVLLQLKSYRHKTAAEPQYSHGVSMVGLLSMDPPWSSMGHWTMDIPW